MRYIITVGVVLWLLSAQTASASGEPGKPILSVGQVIVLKSVTTKKRVQKGKVARDQIISATQTYTLTGQTTDGFTARTKMTDLVIKAINPAAQVMLEGMVRPFEGREYEMVLSATGQPLKIDGWQRIVTEVFGRAEDQIKALLKDKEPKAYQQFLKMFQPLLVRVKSMSDADAARDMSQGLALWAEWHGTQLPAGNTVSFELPGASPFGGEPVKYDATATMHAEKDGMIAVDVAQALGHKELTKLLTSVMKAFGLTDNEQIKASVTQLLKQKSDMRIKQRFELNATTGLTRRVTMSKITRIGSAIVDTEERTITASVSN